MTSPATMGSTDSAEMSRTIARAASGQSRARRLAEWVDGVRSRFAGDEASRKRLRRWSLILGSVAVVGAGVGGYFLFRPYPEPDYATAPIDELFNFTLLRDEFNKLSIERRLALLAALRERIEKMNSSDSMLLAAFGAGIMGKAREQLEENASKLAIDLWDKHAKDYQKVAPEDQEAFLDEAFIDFVTQMSVVAGQTPDEDPREILEDAKQQARDDQAALKEGQGPGGRMMGRAFDVLYNNVGDNATPQQRERGKLMMRDMMRRLRGQDIATGKPATGPG